MIDVHRRAEGFAARSGTFLQDTFRLFLGKAGKAGEGGNVVCPILNGLHGANPNRGALEPGVAIQIALGITWSVTLAAHGDVLDEVAAALDLAFVGGGCGNAVWLGRGNRGPDSEGND